MLDKPTPVAAARVICDMRSPNDDLKRRGAGATALRGDRARVTIAGWLTSPRIDDTHLGFAEFFELVLQQPAALSRPDQHKGEDRQDTGGERQRHAQSWSAGRPHARE